MTHDLPRLAASLLSNFVTIRFSRHEPVWAFEKWGLSVETNSRCLNNAVRCEELLVRCHRSNLRQGLHNHGHYEFLDRVEGVLGGDWRIHLFVADEAAMRLVPQITDGMVGPGDPSTSIQVRSWSGAFSVSKTFIDSRDDTIGWTTICHD
jgi:hypothetical protein